MDAANDDVSFSYRPGDVADLINALRAFAGATDETLAAMGQRARDHALAHDWHLAGRQLSDIIHGMLARRGSSAFGRRSPSEREDVATPGYLASLTRPLQDAAD